MSIDSYGELLAHVGHEIKCVTYGAPGDPENVAIECETCSMVLLDYYKPSRFVVVAKFQDNPAGDYLGFVPISLPPDDLLDGPNVAINRLSAINRVQHFDDWTAVTDGTGDPVFFPEDFAAFEALWALAGNLQAFDDIMTIAVRLATHLDKLGDEQLTIIEDGGSFVAEQLNKLRDAVHEINI